LSRSVKDILDGKPVDDRSAAVTRAVKEILGWVNWLRAKDIASCVSPLTVAHNAFYAVYDYPPEVDGKFTRIVESIRDVEAIQPSIVMASEHDEVAAWKRLKAIDLNVFNNVATEEVKESIKKTKPQPKNSILNFEDFSVDTQTTTKTTTESMTTPTTPAQLVNLQNAQQQQRAFAENDVADIISTNQGDNYLYDSTHDNFYTYDDDKGVWYVQDEMHVKTSNCKRFRYFCNRWSSP